MKLRRVIKGDFGHILCDQIAVFEHYFVSNIHHELGYELRFRLKGTELYMHHTLDLCDWVKDEGILDIYSKVEGETKDITDFYEEIVKKAINPSFQASVKKCLFKHILVGDIETGSHDLQIDHGFIECEINLDSMIISLFAQEIEKWKKVVESTK